MPKTRRLSFEGPVASMRGGGHAIAVDPELMAAIGDVVAVELRIDDDPQPTDGVPPDLAQALGQDPSAAAAWERLSPSSRRAHVGAILDAKRPDARARRVAKTVETSREAGA